MSQNTSTHEYEIVVLSTPEAVWQALTNGEQTQKYYFGCRVESDWQVGSSCRYYGPKGGVDLDGEIIEIEPQQRLLTTFKPMWFPQKEGEKPSTLTWQIIPLGPTSQIKLTHSDVDDAAFEAGRMHMGWVYCLSSLKTLLETGESLPNIFAS
jgi:uncharacterized protein YndB with AHSA1/START domain